jgi:hypothetical protein
MPVDQLAKHTESGFAGLLGKWTRIGISNGDLAGRVAMTTTRAMPPSSEIFEVERGTGIHHCTPSVTTDGTREGHSLFESRGSFASTHLAQVNLLTFLETQHPRKRIIMACTGFGLLHIGEDLFSPLRD